MEERKEAPRTGPNSFVKEKNQLTFIKSQYNNIDNKIAIIGRYSPNADFKSICRNYAGQ